MNGPTLAERVVHVYLRPETRRDLIELAQMRNQTLSGCVRDLLVHAIEDLAEKGTLFEATHEPPYIAKRGANSIRVKGRKE